MRRRVSFVLKRNFAFKGYLLIFKLINAERLPASASVWRKHPTRFLERSNVQPPSVRGKLVGQVSADQQASSGQYEFHMMRLVLWIFKMRPFDQKVPAWNSVRVCFQFVYAVVDGFFQAKNWKKNLKEKRLLLYNVNTFEARLKLRPLRWLVKAFFAFCNAKAGSCAVAKFERWIWVGLHNLIRRLSIRSQEFWWWTRKSSLTDFKVTWIQEDELCKRFGEAVGPSNWKL